MKYQGITIIKRKDCNTWCARFRKNGKQFYVSAKTQQECYDKLKLALKKQKQIEFKQLKEPKKKEPKSMTFLEWYKKWLNIYKTDLKPGTKKDYEVCLNHLSCLHKIPINQITSIMIMEELNKISGERTKQKVYELANAIFNKALQNEIIQKNPMTIIDKPKHRRVNGKALSNIDEEIMEKYLIDHNLDMFLICLYQGLRKGEMLALTIDDIDFDKNIITINKNLDRFNDISTTKNIYSNRVIPLFEKTKIILEKYKNTKGRLFNYNQRKCEKIFQKVVKDLNVKYTIHSLRHTFVTKCQEVGVPLHIVQKWVGHNIGSKVTNEVYTHSREKAEYENIEKMNNYN